MRLGSPARLSWATVADDMNYWLVIYRFAWGVLGVLVTIGLVCIFVPRCNKLRAMQRKRIELQTENRTLEAMTQELRIKQERFSTEPPFVERTAREIGMVKTNETVYKFTNDNSRTSHAPR